jgi:hypothetical protein
MYVRRITDQHRIDQHVTMSPNSVQTRTGWLKVVTPHIIFGHRRPWA